MSIEEFSDESRLAETLDRVPTIIDGLNQSVASIAEGLANARMLGATSDEQRTQLHETLAHPEGESPRGNMIVEALLKKGLLVYDEVNTARFRSYDAYTDLPSADALVNLLDDHEIALAIDPDTDPRTLAKIIENYHKRFMQPSFIPKTPFQIQRRNFPYKLEVITLDKDGWAMRRMIGSISGDRRDCNRIGLWLFENDSYYIPSAGYHELPRNLKSGPRGEVYDDRRGLETCNLFDGCKTYDRSNVWFVLKEREAIEQN